MLSGSLFSQSEKVMKKKQSIVMEHTMLEPTDIKGWKMLVEEKLQDEVDCSISGIRLNNNKSFLVFIANRLLIK